MSVHVLPGDSLASSFKSLALNGEMIVCRECLIDGDVSGDNLNKFFKRRADYLSDKYSSSSQYYIDSVQSELEKLMPLPKWSEINLWFEYDLFCQVNMWFLISLLNKHGQKNIYRIY